MIRRISPRKVQTRCGIPFVVAFLFRNVLKGIRKIFEATEKRSRAQILQVPMGITAFDASLRIFPGYILSRLWPSVCHVPKATRPLCVFCGRSTRSSWLQHYPLQPPNHCGTWYLASTLVTKAHQHSLTLGHYRELKETINRSGQKR
jgi:hypothetical protein